MRQIKNFLPLLSLLLLLAGGSGLLRNPTPVQAGFSRSLDEAPAPAGLKGVSPGRGYPSSPPGAHIVLHATNVPEGAWGIVQWQDSKGVWQTVDGWQGSLPGHSRWWVAAKDFGTGPFRWAIFSRPGGELLRASGPFILPAHLNETITVYVALAP